MTTPSPGRVSPRARLALWWGLLLVVGLVTFVALRPDDAKVADGPRPPHPSDTTSSADADADADPDADGSSGDRSGGEGPAGEDPADEDPALEGTAGTDVATSPTAPATPAPGADTEGAARSGAAFDGQEPDDTSRNTATTQPLDESGCLPGYAGACLPPAPPVLTCADIAERGILVTGPDPHGLDVDGDGTACPSELPPAATAPGTPADPLD